MYWKLERIPNNTFKVHTVYQDQPKTICVLMFDIPREYMSLTNFIKNQVKL